MLRWTMLSIVLLSMAVVSGCPYSAKVPLAEPKPGLLDNRLIGNWIGVDDKGDSSEVRIFPFNQSEYYVEVQDKGGEPVRFRAYPFDIDGSRFLNVTELSIRPAGSDYSFAHVTFSGDAEAAVSFVGDAIVPEDLQEDARGLAAFLAAHADDPGLDDAETKLTLHRIE